MTTSQTDRIAAYFDSVSNARDQLLDSNLIVRYEQAVRQQAVLTALQPAAGDTLLDIGCGNGRDLRAYIRRGARPIGTDFSFGMLRDAQVELEHDGYSGRAALVSGDATRLPFVDAACTKLTCSEVIEHVPDYEKVFGEIARVLKSGGIFVVTTPNRRSLYGLYRRVEDAWRALRPRRQRSALAGAAPAVAHPYDVWKAVSEVTRAAAQAGLQVERVAGACYIPSHATYRLPAWLQQVIVSLVRRLEGLLARLVPRHGYTIVVIGRKA